MSFDKIRKEKAESADFMVDEITGIIKTFGKRSPGSRGETDAVEYMGKLLKSYADDVKIEPFEFHPGAFYGWIYMVIAFGLLAMVCLFFMPILSVILVVASIALLLCEFVFYRETVDKLFKKATSHNLTAVKKPTGEVKRRVFINGHPDAAWEWTVNYRMGGVAFGAHFFITIGGYAYVLVLAITSLVLDGAAPFVLRGGNLFTASLASLAFLPFWIAMCFMWNKKVVVDGANDNLTGCLLGIAVLKAMKESGTELENTEVGVLLTGSEEAGLRGAKAWTKAHKEDYKDCETIIFSFDTIREAKFLSVNLRDLNNTVRADKHAADLFKNAADEVGIHCAEGTVPFGACDGAAFNQGGFQSVSITALDHNLRDYYHTRRDTYDNMDTKCLADTFEVLVKAIEDFDSGK